jgi:hypothetical protein
VAGVEAVEMPHRLDAGVGLGCRHGHLGLFQVPGVSDY